MSKLLKNHFFYSSLITIVVLGLIIASYVFGWTTPSANPPDSNLPAPINTGSQDQTKSGGLNIGGNVGIGTTTPSSPLTVAGNTTITGDLIASANTLSNCAWTSYTCDASQTCASPKIVTGVERYTTGALCGTAPTLWYQMRLYCCNL